jgi:hypothetical protein
VGLSAAISILMFLPLELDGELLILYSATDTCFSSTFLLETPVSTFLKLADTSFLWFGVLIV